MPTDNTVHARPQVDDDEVLAAARSLFGPAFSLAQSYRDVLASDGLERGFIGPKETPRLWVRHVLNCGLFAAHLDESVSTLVDIGSGAGLPGIVIALMRPDIAVTCLDTQAKRCEFLTEVSNRLGLNNVTVIWGRAEDPAIIDRITAHGGADVVTARAVAPLAKLATWALPLVAPKGKVMALKGETAAQEIVRDAKRVRAAGGTTPQLVTLFDDHVAGPLRCVCFARRPRR